jgi:type III secretion system YscI/HrpB-like protein
MDTTAVSQTTQAPPARQFAPASVDQVDAFTRALFGSGTNLPETQATADLQRHAIDFDGTLSTSLDSAQLAMRPGDMLVTQSTLLHSIVQVDLTAKAAGLVSQSINKLVNMQ